MQRKPGLGPAFSEPPSVASVRAHERSRRRPISTAASVASTSFPGEHGALGLRVYQPGVAGTGEAGSAQRGGLVFFHAGGFVAGDEASHDVLCARLSAASECVVVSCAYPLAPEHPFPSALEDAYFAACFVHEHADELGIDHRRLAIAGIEVGAGLATGVARLAKERRNPALVFQLLLDPVFDLRPAAVSGMTVSGVASLEWALAHYASPSERQDPRCSPVVATNLIGLPSASIVYSTGAGVAEQAEAYAAQLRDVHVTVSLEALPAVFLEGETEDSDGQRALGAAVRALREATRER